MGKTKLLEVSVDENGTLNVETNREEDMVLSLSSFIIRAFIEKNNKPMQLLLATVLHTLAQEKSGALAEEFIDNLKENIGDYRRAYAEFSKWSKEKMN